MIASLPVPVLVGLASAWGPRELSPIIAASILAVAAIAALAIWRDTRRAQADSAWKQAMLARGLSTDEMERLIRAVLPPRPEPDEEGQRMESLTYTLGQGVNSGEVMEAVLRAYRGEDEEGRELLYRALSGLYEAGDLGDEKALAVVRAIPSADERPRPSKAEKAGIEHLSDSLS